MAIVLWPRSVTLREFERSQGLLALGIDELHREGCRRTTFSAVLLTPGPLETDAGARSVPM